MKCRWRAEDGLELGRIDRRDPRGIEMPEPALELGGPREGLLHRDLLIQRETDQERQRVVGEQAVRLGVAGERERVGLGHGAMVARPSGHPAM